MSKTTLPMANGHAIQVGKLERAINHTVSISGSSAATSVVMSKGLVMLTTTTACFVAAAAAATTGGVYLVPGVPYYFFATVGQKIAAITSGATGTLYVAEL